MACLKTNHQYMRSAAFYFLDQPSSFLAEIQKYLHGATCKDVSGVDDEFVRWLLGLLLREFSHLPVFVLFKKTGLQVSENPISRVLVEKAQWLVQKVFSNIWPTRPFHFWTSHPMCSITFYESM